jgi:hypothetical protein
MCGHKRLGKGLELHMTPKSTSPKMMYRAKRVTESKNRFGGRKKAGLVL